ncbi:mechanosensitive ion channel protein 10 [Dorcoceras hygrometricum]|uniref:Mechanosensitive ion channel protein 10 n=1 Tax=Dorcoceras hygrometricum TaxID=472368 RepID=A0A2Z7A9N8_9LAMI|nr:mechanosensitive ion channel protein 10 [Dorcoceras hygrometricum]
MPLISSSGSEDHPHHQGRKQSRGAHRARRSGYAQGSSELGIFIEALPYPRESPELLRYGEELINPRRRPKFEASLEGPNPRFVLLRSFTHYRTLSHTAYIPLILLSCTADLSIGGASPDMSPAPFDKCSLVAGIRAHSPIPDARRSRGPRRGNSSSAELFGYINWRRLWET